MFCVCLCDDDEEDDNDKSVHTQYQTYGGIAPILANSDRWLPKITQPNWSGSSKLKHQCWGTSLSLPPSPHDNNLNINIRQIVFVFKFWMGDRVNGLDLCAVCTDCWVEMLLLLLLWLLLVMVVVTNIFIQFQNDWAWESQ